MGETEPGLIGKKILLQIAVMPTKAVRRPVKPCKTPLPIQDIGKTHERNGPKLGMRVYHDQLGMRVYHDHLQN